MNTNFTFQQRADAFRETASNPRRRAEFAESRAAVLIPLLPEQSTVRAIYQSEQLAPGASARYDIPFADIDIVYMMPQIGGTPTAQVEGSEMYVDTFGLHGGVEYQMDVARDGRFQVGERATTLLLNNFLRQEEMVGWSLIQTHAASLDSTQTMTAFKDDGTLPTIGAYGNLNIHTINEVTTKADEIGVGGRRVTDIFISPRRFNDLRQQISTTALPDSIRENLWNGGKGNENPGQLRVHKVYNRNLVNDDVGYAFTQKEGYMYGVMPIRQNLETVDNPIAMLEWKIGILGRERLGFGILDAKGLIKINFKRLS
jgi:hypothetical protein